jgi:hypothetical protein
MEGQETTVDGGRARTALSQLETTSPFDIEHPDIDRTRYSV